MKRCNFLNYFCSITSCRTRAATPCTLWGVFLTLYLLHNLHKIHPIKSDSECSVPVSCYFITLVTFSPPLYANIVKWLLTGKGSTLKETEKETEEIRSQALVLTDYPTTEFAVFCPEWVHSQNMLKCQLTEFRAKGQNVVNLIHQFIVKTEINVHKQREKEGGFNAVNLLKLFAADRTNICFQMSPSGVFTVRIWALIGFWWDSARKMHFGEMSELIVLQTSRQSFSNRGPVKLSLCLCTAVVT